MVHEMFPYLCVDNAAGAIEFYKTAFGAKEKLRLDDPGGRIGHAELDFNGATLMLADEFPEFGIKGAKSFGGTPVTIHLHVDNADEVIASAVSAGATVEQEAQDQFYGERSGSIIDPFGHRWMIGHHVEDVSPEEMQNRYSKMMSGD